MSASMSFEDMSFPYHGALRHVLNQVNLKVKEGELL